MKQDIRTKLNYVIGIDPDVKKNGYAMVDVATRKVTISTTTLPSCRPIPILLLNIRSMEW